MDVVVAFKVGEEGGHGGVDVAHYGDAVDGAEGWEGVEVGVAFVDEGEGKAGAAEREVVGYYVGDGVGGCCAPGEGLYVLEIYSCWGCHFGDVFGNGVGSRECNFDGLESI